MLEETFLHILLDGAMNKARQNLLTAVVQASLSCKQLQLTALGRVVGPSQKSKQRIKPRSGVRKLDRTLSNDHIHAEIPKIYERACELILKKNQRPIIIVDWSKYPNSDDYIIRASMPVASRSLTLYEELHPTKLAHHPSVHKSFLDRLKLTLPKQCKPIIVTDAGFKNPWFKKVISLGWDYIGRVRGLTHYQDPSSYKCAPCKSLYPRASYKMTYIGRKILTKKNPLQTHFYMMKKRSKKRINMTKKGYRSQHKDSKACSKSAKEPWLLVSSIASSAEMVRKIYSERMKIEESFRDMKSASYGLGLSTSKTRCTKRRAVLLLINMIATLLAWTVGQAAEKLGLQRDYQVQSTRHKRVVSLVSLGLQILGEKIPIPKALQNRALCRSIYHE